MWITAVLLFLTRYLCSNAREAPFIISTSVFPRLTWLNINTSIVQFGDMYCSDSLEVGTRLLLPVCFWGRTAAQGFMLGDQNQLKPVWGRGRADRNNAASVLRWGKELDLAPPWQPLGSATEAQTLLLAAVNPTAMEQGEFGKGRGLGDMAAWGSVSHTCTNTGAYELVCFYVSVLLVVQRVTQEDPYQDDHHSPDPWM